MKIKYKLSMFKMTIFQKLLIGIIGMLMLNTIMTVVAIVSINKLESTSKIMLKESANYNNLHNLKLNFNQLLMPANDYLIHGNVIEFSNFERIDSITKEKIKMCNTFSKGQFGKDFMRNIENRFSEVETYSRVIFNFKKPVGNKEGAILMEQMDEITDEVTKEINSLLIISSKNMDYYINTNQATNIKASRIIIFVGLFIMICLVVGGFFYVQEITKPIENLSLTVKRVSSGDLSSKADVNTRTRDEIDDFAKLFNNMIGSLEKTTISRDYFNNILNRMADTLIITDINDKILIANQAALDLLEYKEEELLGKSIEIILSKRDENGVMVSLDYASKSIDEESQNIYKIYYSNSNRAIPVSFSKSFIYDEKNKKKGIFYIAFHATEEHQEGQESLTQTSESEKNIKIVGDIPLTNRELEIIKLIIGGLSNRDIADKLFISIRTVETHRKNIMQKLHTKNIIDLVHYATQNGII